MRASRTLFRRGLGLVLLITTRGGAGPAALPAAGAPALSEGLVLAAVDGTALRDAAQWTFRLDREVTLGTLRVPAGATYPLLPGHALAALDRRLPGGGPLRLWARVTHERGRTTLYPTYFVPLLAAAPAEGGTTASTPPPSAIGIPAAVLERMRVEGVAAPRADDAPLAIEPDALLLGRRGYLERDGETRFFVLAGLGRNAPSERLRLLPGHTPQAMEALQAEAAERLAFRVSGIRTSYQGRTYLLLHRAVPLHGYGNFDL